MAKEAFNRKRSIFCGPLEKDLQKRLVKCFVWSVVLYGAETWTLRRSEQKQLEAFAMWVWTEKIKKCNCARKKGRRKNNAGTDKEEENKLAGPLAKRNCLLKDALEGMINGKKFRSRRSDDRQHHYKWTVCTYKKEG